MRTDGRSVTCCLRATDEELEEDPEAFDCEACEFCEKQESLTAADDLALEIYDRLQTSVVRDLRLTPLVFDIAQLRLTQRDGLELLDRLDVIHRHRKTPEGVDVGQGDDRE